MQLHEPDWLSVVDTFNSAALGMANWLDALSGLAQASGSRVGQLIGLGSAQSVPFNLVTGLGSDYLEDFIASQGGDPDINPIVRAGTRIPALKVLSSEEFISPEMRRSDAFMNGHARRFDTPYVCLTPLIIDSQMLVGMAVLRTSSQGEISAEQRQLFTSIAPHVRAAVRTQITLEHQGALLMAGALEALTMAVFICNRAGTVKAMTPAAETLLSEGKALRLKCGALGTENQQETRYLTDAIRLATSGLTRPGEPLSRTLLVRGKMAQPLVLEVLSVPQRENSFCFEPRALVVVRSAPPDPDRMRILLRAAYGLTTAEVEVALGLAEGQSPESIAALRNASVATVRKQIRFIYDKLDVHRQSELIARINQLR